MSILDSEGVQLAIEMLVASVAGIIGLWFLKKRTKDREAAKGSADQPSPPSAPPSPPSESS